MSNTLKAVEGGSGFFQKTTTLQGINTLSGSDLRFTKCDRTDMLNRPYGNLFSSFNLPITEQQKEDFSGTSSIYISTAFSGFNQDQIIVVEIPKNEYGELIDGKSISISVPINSAGTNTIINCYTTFFKTNLTGAANDRIYSDPNSESSYFGVNGLDENGNRFSNVAYLFSDQISKPKRTSGLTWSSPTKFSLGKELATFNDPNSALTDIPVGIAYLDKGFIVLTHPTIVSNFAYSAATSSGFDNITSGGAYTGNSSFTQIYFSGATSATTSFNSIITEYVQNVFIIAMPNEFYVSNNPTYLEAYPDGNVNNQPVYVTEVGLFNSKGELIAIAKTSEPIPKTKDNVISMNVKLSL